MNADRRVWKVTFSDQSWVKMFSFYDIELAWGAARHEFGEFATIESLPETDAAVIAFRARAYGPATAENVKAATFEVKPVVDPRLGRAAYAWNYRWPAQLESGVMFYEGLRITRAEFEAI